MLVRTSSVDRDAAPRAISSLVATLVQAAPGIAMSRDPNRTLPNGYGCVHVSTRITLHVTTS